MCKSVVDITDDRVKLRLFGLSLIGHANDWLQYISNGNIQTLKELEDKFLERYCSNAQFVEIKSAITSFAQEEAESLYDAG